MAAEGKLRLLLRLHPGVRERTGNVDRDGNRLEGSACACMSCSRNRGSPPAHHFKSLPTISYLLYCISSQYQPKVLLGVLYTSLKLCYGRSTGPSILGTETKA